LTKTNTEKGKAINDDEGLPIGKEGFLYLNILERFDSQRLF